MWSTASVNYKNKVAKDNARKSLEAVFDFDKNWHIFKHFSESPSSKSLYTPSGFTILDTANNPIDLKKTLHFNKNKPNLNKQVHHFNTFLVL